MKRGREGWETLRKREMSTVLKSEVRQSKRKHQKKGLGFIEIHHLVSNMPGVNGPNGRKYKKTICTATKSLGQSNALVGIQSEDLNNTRI